MQAVYIGGVFIAIDRGLPAGVTALVVGMQPLLTGVGAGWLLGEQVTARQWTGLVLGLVGVVLVLGGKVGGTGIAPADLARMLVPAIAALLGITVGTLYQKRFCPRFEFASGAVVQFLPTLLVLAGLAASTETMQVDWAGELIATILWSSLVLSVGAIGLLNFLIRRGNAVDVASLFYLTPPTTALMAWLGFRETLGPVALAGMVIAVIGVWLARRREPPAVAQ